MKRLNIQEINTSPEFMIKKFELIRKALEDLNNKLMVKDVDSEVHKPAELPEEDEYKRNTPYLKEVEAEEEELDELTKREKPFVSNRSKRLVSTPMDFIINFETDGCEEESESWTSEGVS